MKFEIKHRFNGDVLFSIKAKSLKLAVELAISSNTNLSMADLSNTNLTNANLTNAYLYGANLSRAIGVNKYITTQLYILLDQVGEIRAYKLTNEKDEGTYFGGIKYIIGETIKEKADTNENKDCSYGISLATLDWCIKEWKTGYKIKIVGFTKKDIAAIPVGSDGKFRVSRCKIIKEVNLKEIGLIK